MVNKKIFLSVFVLAILFSSMFFVSAKLEIKKQIITETVIPEFENLAVFDLEITNLGDSDTFLVYSLAGVKVEEQEFYLYSFGKKTLTVSVYPEDSILEKEVVYPFVLKIRAEKTGEITQEILTVRILTLDKALTVGVDNIYFEDTEARVFIKNNADIPIENINSRIYSSFFDFEEDFNLESNERKDFVVSLDKEKTKMLQAGTYAVLADIVVNQDEAKLEGSFKFEEKLILETRESKEGFFINKYRIEKENLGNLPIVTDVVIRKNIISRLFTNFNAEPVEARREGFSVFYTFRKEVLPGTTFELVTTTNYIYPLLALIILIVLLRVLFVYTSSQIKIGKHARFVKTKGGEFALQISLVVKANKFVERISLFDKLPYSVRLHKEFRGEAPKRIDEQSKRIEWYIENLQAGEERVYNYIIFSKVAPFGKFELPSAKAVYEREGKIKEAVSNRVYFIHEGVKSD
jgi:hypothetical protein